MLNVKIMIVDDEPLILAGIENIINNEFSASMEILKAFDGIDALDQLENFTPDLIITDICMPEMSGLELIEKVIGRRICSRFIILTGHAEFEYARQAIRYKALDYILKPIDKVKLIEILSGISKDIDQEQEILIKQEVRRIQEIKNRYSESVSKMIDYVNKNYMKDISLDEVAEAVNLHPNYASSLFKKELGSSFIQYLNSYKINKAKTLIDANVELSFDKVAEMVGYENSCRFIKVFKKYCNITPGEYRNKIN